MEQLGSHWTDFHEILQWEVLLNQFRKFRFFELADAVHED